MTQRISLIAALDRNGVIGSGGEIPWRLPADLKYFKRVTMGKPLIIGRKTYESIGRPLPGRHNIVLTRQRHYQAPGCTVVHSIEEALAATGDAEEVMVAGGGSVYRHFLPHADRLYLTFVETTAGGETTFPPFDRDKWNLIFEEAHPADERNPYAYRFTVFERRRSMENTIFIYEGDNRPAQSFPAPADRRAARNLWCFLVGNLQPGFVVALAEGEAKISWASGDNVPVHLYERLMGGDDLSDLVGGQ